MEKRKKVTLTVELIVPVDEVRDSANLFTRLKAKVALNKAFYKTFSGVDSRMGVDTIEIISSEVLDN